MFHRVIRTIVKHNAIFRGHVIQHAPKCVTFSAATLAARPLTMQRLTNGIGAVRDQGGRDGRPRTRAGPVRELMCTLREMFVLVIRTLIALIRLLIKVAGLPLKCIELLITELDQSCGVVPIAAGDT